MTEFTLPSIDQREKTLEKLFEAIEKYSESDVQRIFQGGGYSLDPPPWSGKATDEIGANYFDSKYYLLSDYFLFLTSWTPDKIDQRTKRVKGVIKDMASDIAADMSWGISKSVQGILESKISKRLEYIGT